MASTCLHIKLNDPYCILYVSQINHMSFVLWCTSTFLTSIPDTFLLDKHYNNSLESFRIIIIVLYKCRTNLYRETIWAITAINIKKRNILILWGPSFAFYLILSNNSPRGTNYSQYCCALTITSLHTRLTKGLLTANRHL